MSDTREIFKELFLCGITSDSVSRDIVLPSEYSEDWSVPCMELRFRPYIGIIFWSTAKFEEINLYRI